MPVSDIANRLDTVGGLEWSNRWFLRKAKANIGDNEITFLNTQKPGKKGFNEMVGKNVFTENAAAKALGLIV
ncbi:MAG: hypothetical protein LBK53_09085 [Heliobacteriaceae bacterium]|jgi:hypothetical protein|nr:hypothetical protein [Heliobacteriaceae bacterium]